MDTNTYLSQTYENMGRNLVVEESYFEHDSRFYNLAQAIKALPSGRVLDMGCGQGALLAHIKDSHSVFGLEWDSGALAVTRSRGITAERADLNEASSLPFPGPFDCIVCSEVCEHLLNPRNAFRLAWQNLAEGGRFIVTVPNAVPLFVRLRVLFGASCDWLHYPSTDTELTGHIRFYTLQTLIALAEQEGFALQSKRGLSWRMNGRFWRRAFYAIARLRRSKNISKSAMLLDSQFGRMFPGLSPGLMVVLAKNAIPRPASEGAVQS